MSRAILARRAAEDKREAADAVVRDTRRAMDIAVFEHRTQRKIDSRVAREKVGSIQRRMAEDVNRRRARYVGCAWLSCGGCARVVGPLCATVRAAAASEAVPMLCHAPHRHARSYCRPSYRLAELLSSEDDMYSQLLSETFESADQRKARLFAKAKALRAAREEKRRQFVDRIAQERWRCVLSSGLSRGRARWVPLPAACVCLVWRLLLGAALRPCLCARYRLPAHLAATPRVAALVPAGRVRTTCGLSTRLLWQSAAPRTALGS